MARTAKSGNEAATEVAVKVPTIAPEILSGISSFADAVQAATEAFGQENIVVASDVLGDGFKMQENKDALIGVGMFLAQWTFSMGDHGEFVIARLVTEDDRKLILVDGSTGICDQLRKYSESSGRYGGMFVRKGLRRSDYEYVDEKTGEMKDAHTYYLDVSA